MLRIIGGTLITPHETLNDHTLIIENGKIAAIASGVPAGEGDIMDARGLTVAPGMIDVHVHGSVGHDVMDATPEALHTMARFFAQHGVTAFLPTTMTAPHDAITAAVQNAANTPPPTDGAQPIGLHLEGPYLNTDHKGAQPAIHLRLPDIAEFDGWINTAKTYLMTIAPELNGAFKLIEHGAERGIEFAIGHSGASFEQVAAANSLGLRQATHTFNGMAGLHHRQPGTLGAVLWDDDIYAQIIADGVHVHPAMVKVLIRAKGTRRVILITDAMRAAGLDDGDYDLGGQAVFVRNGMATLEDGTLAGSTVTMDAALRNVMQFARLTLAEALPMATSVPAEALRLNGQKGVLAVGADADIVLFDENIHVHTTIINGRVIYQRGGR